MSMYYAVEWLGRGGDGNSSSSFCTWGGSAATTAAVSGLQGLIKGVVLALVKVWPKATCRTCCWDGIIESSNLAKKSMHRIGVATAASKKIKFEVLAGKTDDAVAETLDRNLLAIGPHKVRTCGRRRAGMQQD